MIYRLKSWSSSPQTVSLMGQNWSPSTHRFEYIRGIITAVFFGDILRLAVTNHLRFVDPFRHRSEGKNLHGNNVKTTWKSTNIPWTNGLVQGKIYIDLPEPQLIFIYISYIIGTVHGFRLKSLQKTIDSLIDEGPEGPRNHPNNHLSSQVIDKTNILHGTILVIWH